MSLKSLFLKYKYLDFIIYTCFGAAATAVNMLSYYLLYEKAGVNNVASTFLSWLFAVTFAFFTNKFFVFFSYTFKLKTVAKEAWMFYSCRAFTGALDILIMFLAVNILSYPAMLWKLISNFIVGVINYLAGKIVIFNHKEKRDKKASTEDQ